VKGIGIALVVLALLIGVIPALTNCDATWQPFSALLGVKPMDSMGAGTGAPVVHMRCYRTAEASWWAAVPLAALGVGMTITSRKPVLLGLAGGAALFGAAAIFLPTVMPGTCGSPDAVCNLLLKPSLILFGGMGIALSAVGLVVVSRRPDALATEETGDDA
jgi:hypothetical protein